MLGLGGKKLHVRVMGFAIAIVVIVLAVALGSQLESSRSAPSAFGGPVPLYTGGNGSHIPCGPAPCGPDSVRP
jgi:hypothetical protein